MPQIRERALVLRRRKMGEADALLTLLGEVHGKQTAKAKSVTKTTSKLAGTLQPYNVIDVLLYAPAEDRDVWTITQASIVRHHTTLQNDVIRYAYSGCAAELADALTEPGEAVPELYHLIVAALDYWDRNIPTLLELVAFHLRILYLVGLSPVFQYCVRCSRTNSPTWFFSSRDGGVVCGNCSNHGDRLVPDEVWRTFLLLAGGGKASQCRIDNQNAKRMLEILHEHLEFHGSIRQRAWRFLEEVVK